VARWLSKVARAKSRDIMNYDVDFVHVGAFFDVRSIKAILPCRMQPSKKRQQQECKIPKAAKNSKQRQERVLRCSWGAIRLTRRLGTAARYQTL
jgi:hypothetical protein